MKPQREEMADGSIWYSCGICTSLHEEKKDAKDCCDETKHG